MNLRLTILLLLITFFAKSQTAVIRGTVFDGDSNQPIPHASIFLSNSSISTQSDNDGKFILVVSKPGQYDLVVKMLGYQAFSKTMLINANQPELKVMLEPKSQFLKPVVINIDPNRDKYLKMFLKDFIGTDPLAEQCKVVNPEILFLHYDKKKQLLEASSDDFLIIENKGIGYRIKYLLNEFSRDYKQGIVFYQGNTLFEDLTGSKGRLKRWSKNREDVYYGSSMHFFRALQANKIQEDKFSVFRLIRKPNLNRPADSIIEAKRQQFSHTNNDSLSYWNSISHQPKYFQYLRSDTLAIEQQTEGTTALSFQNCMYVVYKGKHDYGYSPVFKSDEVGNYPVSIATLRAPAIYIDKNGIVINARDVLFEGAWTDGVSHLLPYNYEPEKKK